MWCRGPDRLDRAETDVLTGTFSKHRLLAFRNSSEGRDFSKGAICPHFSTKYFATSFYLTPQERGPEVFANRPAARFCAGWQQAVDGSFLSPLRFRKMGRLVGVPVSVVLCRVLGLVLECSSFRRYRLGGDVIFYRGT